MTNNKLEMNNNRADLIRQYSSLAIGIAVCLMGAFLMGWGEPILGENHTGISTVIGIIGIGIIARTRKGMENKI